MGTLEEDDLKSGLNGARRIRSSAESEHVLSAQDIPSRNADDRLHGQNWFRGCHTLPW